MCTCNNVQSIKYKYIYRQKKLVILQSSLWLLSKFKSFRYRTSHIAYPVSVNSKRRTHLFHSLRSISILFGLNYMSHRRTSLNWHRWISCSADYTDGMKIVAVMMLASISTFIYTLFSCRGHTHFTINQQMKSREYPICTAVDIPCSW